MGALRHLIGFLHEDHSALGQRFHHVLVVDDFLADINGCAVLLQRLFYRLHCTVHTRAVPAGGG